jgi:PEP-CTERM motif
MNITTKYLLAIFLAIFTTTSTIRAEIPTFLTAVNEYTGYTDAPQRVRVYTDGNLTFSNNPPIFAPSGYSTNQQLRDLVQASNGDIYAGFGYRGLNGGVFGKLSGTTWSLYTIPGWSFHTNDGLDGGLALAGNHLYLSNAFSGGGQHGIVDVNLATGSVSSFGIGIESKDIAISGNFIYALEDYTTVYKFRLDDRSLVSTITLGFHGEHRGIAIDSSGFIYGTYGDSIRKFSQTGTLVGSLRTTIGLMGDIDVDPLTGIILAGGAFAGRTVVTDTSLQSFQAFNVSDSANGGESFVAFPGQVPEPGSASLLLLGFAGLAVRRRRK